MQDQMPSCIGITDVTQEMPTQNISSKAATIGRARGIAICEALPSPGAEASEEVLVPAELVPVGEELLELDTPVAVGLVPVEDEVVAPETSDVPLLMVT